MNYININYVVSKYLFKFSYEVFLKKFANVTINKIILLNKF